MKTDPVARRRHDIGKNGVPVHVLGKPGPLDREELEIVKRHPLLGFEQLREAQSISDTQLSVVLHHHEAMNGSGYPDGLHGTLIPRYARLAHIVDVFDALTTKRVYKEAVSREEAIKVMCNGMRSSFDTEMLETFCRFLGFDNGTKPAGPKKKIQINFNNQVIIQLDEGKRLKSALVGLEHGEYLILRVSGLNYMQDLFKDKRSVIARYTHNGIAYGFRSTVIGSVAYPLRLLFLAYPETVEEISLRKEPRVDCFLPSKITIRNNTYDGALMDVSENGCKLVLRHVARESLPRVLMDERVHTWIQLLSEQSGDEFNGIVRGIEDDEERIMLGIQFIESSQSAKNHLREFIERILKLVG